MEFVPKPSFSELAAEGAALGASRTLVGAASGGLRPSTEGMVGADVAAPAGDSVGSRRPSKADGVEDVRERDVGEAWETVSLHGELDFLSGEPFPFAPYGKLRISFVEIDLQVGTARETRTSPFILSKRTVSPTWIGTPVSPQVVSTQERRAPGEGGGSS